MNKKEKWTLSVVSIFPIKFQFSDKQFQRHIAWSILVSTYEFNTTGEDEEEDGQKLSLRDEELMADLTMEELKQAFRWFVIIFEI